MPSNQFSKQPQQLSSAFGGYLNGGHGDQVVGGVMTGIPSGLTSIGVNAGGQDIPGDRIVIGMADALALSNTDIGTLYGGVYQYVTFLSTATLAAVLGKATFQATSEDDDSYTVTSDETQAQGANLWAGVFINVITKGYSGYQQIAGKATVLFTTPLTGTGAAGAAAFVAGDGAGRFDVFDGIGTNPTFDQVQTMQMRYAGVLEAAAAANTASIIDIPMRQVRW